MIIRTQETEIRYYNSVIATIKDFERALYD